MLIAFIGSGVGCLQPPGTGMSYTAVRGGEVTMAFLVYGYMCATNVVLGTLMWAPHGLTVVRQGRRQRRKYGFKFRMATYLPWGDGLLRHYAVIVFTGIVAGAGFIVPSAVFARSDLPVGSATLLSWSSKAWLALWALTALRVGFRWIKLAEPVAGVFQLAGVAVAVSLLQFGGPSFVRFDTDGVGNLGILSIPLVGSVVGACGVLYLKKVKEKEGEHFARLEKSPVTDEVDTFIAAKIMGCSSAFTAVFCAVGFAVAASVQGLPTIVDRGYLLYGLGVITLGCIGNRVGWRAAIGGSPPLNGIGSTAALGFSFLWNWLIQGLPITVAQIAGASMTLAGAVAVALTFKDVRARLRKWLRLGREGGVIAS